MSNDYSSDPPVEPKGSFLMPILCVVFAEPASLFLANGKYPELFGFVLGAAGKSTAEALLSSDKS